MRSAREAVVDGTEEGMVRLEFRPPLRPPKERAGVGDEAKEAKGACKMQ